MKGPEGKTMGMFDYIKCEYPLPDIELQNEMFQTKDTPDQFLSLYTITKDGRLIYHSYSEEEVPEDERELCKGKPPEQRTDFDKFCGCIRRVDTGTVDVNYNGNLRFYTFIGNAKNWYEYNAVFVNGTAQNIVRAGGEND
jgi:hypothetical protein